MGIDTRMSSYKTYYSGTSDRITNLQLGVTCARRHARPAGRHVLAQRGDRRADGRARLPAGPGHHRQRVRGGGRRRHVAGRDDRVQRRLGGRPEDQRAHPHSLYISRYQLGRDATVYWPSLDLKFVNDTDTWVLVKGFAEGDGISIAIYGGESRRVESSASPLVVTGPRARRACRGSRRSPKGKTVVEEEGLGADADVGDAQGLLSGRRAHPLRDLDDVVRRARRASSASGRRSSRRSRAEEGEAAGSDFRPAPIPTLRRRSLGRSDRLGEPLGHAGRAIRLAVDGGVRV